MNSNFSKADSDLPHVFQWHVGRAAHPGMPLQGGVPVSAPSPIAARGGVSLFRAFGSLCSFGTDYELTIFILMRLAEIS